MSQAHTLRVSRLTGLTDGIFAIAMTILVLDLRLPAGIDTANLSLLLRTEVLDKLFIYAGSFVILGTQWIAMNFQHGFLERVNRPYFWANIFYLMIICVIPFSANLMANYSHNSASIVFYAINLLCGNLGQFLTWLCASIFKLYGAAYSSEAHKAICRRIFVAPLFYMGAIFLAYWNTTIAFIALIMPPLIYIIPGKVDKYAKD